MNESIFSLYYKIKSIIKTKTIVILALLTNFCAMHADASSAAKAMGHIVHPIIFGLSGPELLEKEKELFLQNPCKGFILFDRNIISKEQLITLTKSLKLLYPEREVLIFVDQEGGRVARIKPPIANRLYPSGAYFSNLYDKDKGQARGELARNYNALMAELNKLGVDSPCAPVCDISYPGASSVIGDRAFGDRADKVIDLCSSAIAGIRNGSGIPMLKHIPGHGRALVDSHYDLPVVNTSLSELEATDFKVFRELSKQINGNMWGMVAHIIYKALDPLWPATLSGAAITYIRKEIGFTGTLVTDDICMQALHPVVGQKKLILAKVMQLAENNQAWKEEYAAKLNQLFNIRCNQMDNKAILAFCKKKQKEVKEALIASLIKASNMTLSAGCDIILHCSGDMDEMKGICTIFKKL